MNGKCTSSPCTIRATIWTPAPKTWPIWYHWHLEICPRTSIPTGFELGSGLFVNTISPEEAAEQLRNAELPDDL